MEDALAHESAVELVPAGAMFAAVERLGLSRADLRDAVSLSVVAGEVQVDAVLTGNITQKGRTAHLQLKVRNGGDGETLGTHRVRLHRGRADRATARSAADALVPLIEKGRRMVVTGPEGQTPRDGAAAGGFRPVDEADEPPLHDRDLGEPGGGAREPVEALAPAPRVAAGPGTGDISLSAGLVGLSRAYDLRGGVTKDGQPLPHNYETGYFPGIWVRAELYPFALAGEGGGLREVAVEGYVDSGSLDTNLKIVDAQGPRDVRGVETTQRMWGLGLSYRTFPTSTEFGPASLRLLAGWHAASFELEQGTDLYKSIDYRALRLGGDGWYPIGREDAWVFSLRGRLALLWIRADLNDRAHYPTTSGTGWEGAGGLDLDLGGQWALGADYRFYTFPVEFPATAKGRPALDSDDLYHGVVLELGYRL